MSGNAPAPEPTWPPPAPTEPDWLGRLLQASIVGLAVFAIVLIVAEVVR